VLLAQTSWKDIPWCIRGAVGAGDSEFFDTSAQVSLQEPPTMIRQVSARIRSSALSSA
jgi:hypothetical protein